METINKLSAKVGRHLSKSNRTLAAAESCTGGLFSHFITEKPGSSSFFLGSVVAYSNMAKTDLLGVPKDLIARFGAVSHETSRAMAEGARKRFGSDYAVSVTGIAGPGGGTSSKPVGLVFIACAGRDKAVSAQMNFKGSRTKIKESSVKGALETLILFMKEEGEDILA